MSKTAKQVLKYDGCNFFRQRIILSLLSGRSVKFRQLRLTHQSPGITTYERSLLELIDRFTNGTRIEINETGTSVFFQPGMLSGGEVTYECDTGRSIGYYLEVLLCIAPFCKEPLQATLRGITADRYDSSVDRLKYSVLPIEKKFLDDGEGLDIKINKRGSAPDGGGEVVFSCPRVPKLSDVTLLDEGKVWKIRGVAWATKISADVMGRMIDGCRSILTKFLADVKIYKDRRKGLAEGRSPGFGMTLWAQTKTGVVYCAEVVSNPKGSKDGPSVPDDLGKECATCLLCEISRGGCVDSGSQSFACLMMVLRDKDVSKIKMGQLTNYTIGFLRNLRDFFGVTFHIEEEKNADSSLNDEELQTGDQKLILKCSGVGYRNLNRVVL